MPGRSAHCSRKDSLMTLFKRFLSVASLQCFFAMARPSRASLVLLFLYSTVNNLSRLRRALPNTRLKDFLSSNRLLRLKRLLPAIVGIVSVASLYPDESTQTNALGRKLCPTLRATALKDQSTCFRCHPRSESVCACTFQCAGLKCSFHLPTTRLFACATYQARMIV